jgi:zinc transport system substrate-binding protein
MVSQRSLEFSLLVFLFIVICALAWSCTPRRAEKRTVAVSILPQRYLVQQIAGDRVEVQVMVPAGSSPESYDPTPQDIMALVHADAYLKVGNFGFERSWMPRLVEQNPEMRVVDTSEGIVRLVDDDGDEDPHVWTSPTTMKHMAGRVCEALVTLDAEGAATYRQNLQRFEARMDSLERQMRQLVLIAPARTFVIYHPALTYLSHDLGLRQIPIEREHKEPSASDLMRLIETIRQSDARVILLQQEFDDRLVATLAEETGLRVVRINPLSEDWETELSRIVLEVTR